MDQKRVQELMENDDSHLTPEELAAGCHFCWEWDGLVVWPGTGEWGDDPEVCRCGVHKSLQDKEIT